MSLSEKWKELSVLENKKAEHEAAVKVLNAQITELAVKVLPPMMENAEVESMKVEGVGTCSVRTKVYAYFLKENEAAFHKWLKKNRHGGLIKPYIHPPTLKAFATEQLEQQKPLPDILKVTLVPTATIRSK